MTYTYEEARNESLKYFNGDALAAEVFCGKYALQDLNGTIHESNPSQMHRRLAQEFARIECKYKNPLSEEEIYELLSDWTVVPQGGPMSAIGNKFQIQSLSNCFVIESPFDSYGGILKTDQELVQIAKRRGGVGFDISTIRPKGLEAANAARTTDGIGVFMERFSNSCREVAQGGRRGALLLSISVHHPEVSTFANIKRDRLKVTGANVSIRVTNEFLQAVKDGTTYKQRFPVEENVQHLIEKDVDARSVWNDICSAMRDCSEPGMLFWDTIKTQSPSDAYESVGFGTVSTNPCGEITLGISDACRLMLINLSKFVVDPFTSKSYFDYDRFGSVVGKAQRLMDDLIDLEIEAIDKIIAKVKSDPEPDSVKMIELTMWENIRKTTLAGRRTGLGITALADTFAYLNLKYGEEESIEVTHDIYRALALNSYKSSVIMASERGAFKVYDYELEKNHPFINRVMNEDSKLCELYHKHGRRNIANLTTAPAGSTSILTQTSSGCEPVLFVKARRKRKITSADKLARVDEVDKLGDSWQYYDVYHSGVEKWMSITGESDVKNSPYHGSTIEDIEWKSKIDIQAAAQKWICHSISNTTSFPNDVSVDTIKDLCMHAWETGCKGVTVYRTGSRDAVIVKDDEAKKQDTPSIIETNAPKRPKELSCDIHRVSIQGEQYIILVGTLDNKPYEVFAGLQELVEVPKKFKKGVLRKSIKKDGIASYNLSVPVGEDEEILFKDVVNLFNNSTYGAFTRTLSLALRHGVPVTYIVEQLRKDKNSEITSFSASIARVLSKGYIPDGTKVSSDACPQCGSKLTYIQGCVSCASGCGWSKCG